MYNKTPEGVYAGCVGAGKNYVESRDNELRD